MKLPDGYRVEYDPDVWTLYGPGGEGKEVVARFGPGVDPREVEKAAWSHHRGRDHRELAVAALVGIAFGILLGWGAGLETALW